MGNIIGAISIAQRFDPSVFVPATIAKYKIFFTDSMVIAVRLDALASLENILGTMSPLAKVAMALNDWGKIVADVNTNKRFIVEYDNLNLPEVSDVQKIVIPYDKIKAVEIVRAGRDKTPEKVQSSIRFALGVLSPGHIFLLPGSGADEVIGLLSKTPLSDRVKLK